MYIYIYQLPDLIKTDVLRPKMDTSFRILGDLLRKCSRECQNHMLSARCQESFREQSWPVWPVTSNPVSRIGLSFRDITPYITIPPITTQCKIEAALQHLLSELLGKHVQKRSKKCNASTLYKDSFPIHQTTPSHTASLTSITLVEVWFRCTRLLCSCILTTVSRSAGYSNWHKLCAKLPHGEKSTQVSHELRTQLAFSCEAFSAETLKNTEDQQGP